LTAFRAADERGVSEIYNLETQNWGAAHPETTGYIIPTIVEFAKRSNDISLIEAAIKMADWELAIQWENGGIGEPVGVFGQKPRIFNTSQVMLGLLSIYYVTKKSNYLDAAVKAGEWLIDCQDLNGSWVENTYKGARSYHIRSAWSLLELYKVTKESKYYNSALRNLNYTLQLAQDNGFINNTSLENPEKPLTHLIAYTLVGLLEVYRLIDDEDKKVDIMSVLIAAADNLTAYYNQSRESQTYPGFPGTFDKHWRSNDEWTCVAGDAQLEYFLRGMYKQTKYPHYLECAEKLIADLKSIQILNESEKDKNLLGSFTGSFPVQGDYGEFLIPNWGVKFFADSLLQKKYNVNNYLG
jgi:hypothetical protein